MPYEYNSVMIGKDCLSIIFKWVIHRVYRKKLKKRVLSTWRTLALVCKEWNELSWEILNITKLNNSPLRLAIEAESIESVRKIVSSSTCNPLHNKSAMLFKAIQQGNPEIFRVIFDCDKIEDITFTKPYCDSLCTEAAKSGNVDIIKILRSDPRMIFDSKIVFNCALFKARYQLIEYLMSTTNVIPYLEDAMRAASHRWIRYSIQGSKETADLLMSNAQTRKVIEQIGGFRQYGGRVQMYINLR